ncbi:MAG TPA: hypothetical protein VF742_00855, partial [Terracidiphilus sp.]
PLSTMEKGLPWDWESFPQWMDALAKRPLGVNVGALVPFNPLRLYVMGMDASRERVHATEAETRQMQALVHEAMAAGAFGWSSMKTLINRPDDGRFIPVRWRQTRSTWLWRRCCRSLASAASGGHVVRPSGPCRRANPICSVGRCRRVPAFRWIRSKATRPGKAEKIS